MNESVPNPYSPPEAAIGESSEVPPAPPSGPPWLTIWVRPRATIRRILDAEPSIGVFLWAASFGIVVMLFGAVQNHEGDQFSDGGLIARVLGGGLLSGIGLLFFLGFVIHRTGRWLGGKGSQRDLRAAMAWASVPWSPLLVLYLVALGSFGMGLFRLRGRPGMARQEAICLLVLTLGHLLAMAWSTALWVKCVAEAHRFSSVRAIGSAFLAYLVFVGTLGVGMGVGWLVGLWIPR